MAARGNDTAEMAMSRQLPAPKSEFRAIERL